MSADTVFRTIHVTATASLAAIDCLPLPGVGAIAYLSNEIIAAIMTARCNRIDAKELVNEILKDMDILTKAYKLIRDVSAEDLFYQNIVMIRRTLEDVLEVVLKITARGPFKSFLCSGKDKQRIISAKEKLQRDFQRFEMTNSIILVQDVRRTFDTLNCVCRTFDTLNCSKIEEGSHCLDQSVDRSGRNAVESCPPPYAEQEATNTIGGLSLDDHVDSTKVESIKTTYIGQESRQDSFDVQRDPHEVSNTPVWRQCLHAPGQFLRRELTGICIANLRRLSRCLAEACHERKKQTQYVDRLLFSGLRERINRPIVSLYRRLLCL